MASEEIPVREDIMSKAEPIVHYDSMGRGFVYVDSRWMSEARYKSYKPIKTFSTGFWLVLVLLMIPFVLILLACIFGRTEHEQYGYCSNTKPVVCYTYQQLPGKVSH